MEEESLAQFKTPTLMKQDADKNNYFSGPGTGPQLSTGFQAGVSSGENKIIPFPFFPVLLNLRAKA